MAESNGMNLLRTVSLSTVMRFLHMVRSRVEYVHIIPLAAPLVIDTPYPQILLKAACSLSTEKSRKGNLAAHCLLEMHLLKEILRTIYLEHVLLAC